MMRGRSCSTAGIMQLTQAHHHALLLLLRAKHPTATSLSRDGRQQQLPCWRDDGVGGRVGFIKRQQREAMIHLYRLYRLTHLAHQGHHESALTNLLLHTSPLMMTFISSAYNASCPFLPLPYLPQGCNHVSPDCWTAGLDWLRRLLPRLLPILLLLLLLLLFSDQVCLILLRLAC